MDKFEIVRHLSDTERPSEMPIPPLPQCVNHGGTNEEWDEYWVKSAAFYDGTELRRKGK